MIDDIITLKTIVLGPQGSGKSSLLIRYIKGQFSEEYNVTVGVQFSTKLVKIQEEQFVKMQVWDTSGQQAFKSIVRTFYKGIVGIFLTFSLNEEQSLQKLRDWVNEASQFVHEQTLFFLVGTKCDLEEERKVNQTQILKFLSEIRAAFYIQTSAKTGLNIEELFLKSGKIMKKKYLSNRSYRNLVRPMWESGVQSVKIKEDQKSKNSVQQSSRCCK